MKSAFRPLLIYFTLISISLTAQHLDMEMLKGMKARSIGPAGMSGRVTAIDVVLSNTDIIYAGTASGGLWKSESGGVNWSPIFDDQKSASIGALAIDQSNPDVIWVGTGEGNPRNSQTSGNGVYKSLDGGKTWNHLGLAGTRNIHRVIIDPRNSDVVYVGAQGSAWGESKDRGVFKTIDGGQTWEKILYVNEKTGIGELVMDPSNPNKLFANMWEFRRWPWFFKSGGPGSGLYVTYDAGKSWKILTEKDGLPKGELGRMGLAIAPSNPKIVYALIEAKKNGLYKSEDGGFKWKKVSEKNIGNRPFYYAEIYVDPKNENRIYNLHSVVTVSEDGGKTFRRLMTAYGANGIHPDHHAFWIHPEDPNFIMDGNDGGMNISRDRGKTWRFIENLPLAQFYHINYDMEYPYNVYGGMQDNGSWRGPAYVWRAGGIRNAYWEELLFGDGFDVIPHPTNPNLGYAMSQGGNVGRYNLITGHTQFIKPIHPEGVKLRFNWNAGIAQDPFNNNTIYYGSQFLHKSSDMGDNWKIISPDLTTNNPEKQKQLESGGLTFDVTAAENFTSITAIAPSPVRKGVIWVGTDDGNVQLTMNGGKTWTNTTKRIYGVPAGSWVPQIHVSTYDPAEAFVVINNYRNDDWTPYIFHTTNFGKSWKQIVDKKQVWGYTLSFVQDPVVPTLMFVGTEFGLYVSLDGAKNWTKWTQGYPTVSTMDIHIHPREHDLIIGTFGRAAYILDDIRPLRTLSEKGTGLLKKHLFFFEPPTAVLSQNRQASGTRFSGNAMFRGQNRQLGAMLSVVFNPLEKQKAEENDEEKQNEKSKKKKKEKVKVEVLDAEGLIIRTYKTEVDTGLNRITWNLRRQGVRSPSAPKPKPDADKPSGPFVLPGNYMVRISHAKDTVSQIVRVIPDPRAEVNIAHLSALQPSFDRLMELTGLATKAVAHLREAKETIEMVNKQLNTAENEAHKKLQKKAKALQDSIKTLLELINQPTGHQGILRRPDVLSAKLGVANRYLRSGLSGINTTQEYALKHAEKNTREVLTKVNDFFNTEWQDYQKEVKAAKLSPFKKFKTLQLE